MLYEYDGSAEKCPLPLVKTRVILKKMQPGDTCLIRVSDKGLKKNIPQLLKKQAWQFNQYQIDKNIVELTIELKKECS